jgi:hypothetical protein
VPATRHELAQAFRQPLWRGAMALLLLAVLVTAALGGFRRASPIRGSDLPMQAPGGSVDTGLFVIAARAAWTTAKMPGRAFPTPGTHYLVVPLTVTNQADADHGRALPLQEDLVWVPPDGPPVSPDTLLRRDDGGYDVSLPPRLPMPVLAVWKLPANAPPPTSVRIGVLGRTFVPSTPLTTESAWAPGDPKGQWRLPVSAGEDEEAGTP